MEIITGTYPTPFWLDNDNIREASDPYHDFWLFREGERKYNEYSDMLGRNNAPLRMPDDVICFLLESLRWVPTINPAASTWSGWGINGYGPTIINHMGGEKLHEICTGWAQILSQGPEPLILSKGWVVPSQQLPRQWEPALFKTSREKLAADLKQLAEYGQQAATGAWYILHFGI